MADQYANFTNPTIIPSQQYGWQSLSQSTDDVRQEIMKQILARQALQMNIAQKAGEAQMEVWAKMQDPISRALTLGKLRDLGMSPGNMQGAMNNFPSMAQMLKGNPYANLIPQWSTGQQSPVNSAPVFNQPQSSIPMGGQAINFSSFNPIQNPSSQGNPSQEQSNFVTPNIKMGPFGQVPSDITDIKAQNKIAGNKSYSEAVGSAQGKQVSATSMLDNITKNLAADLKAHFIEAGGGGPLAGNITGFSTHLGMSPATYGLKNTVRDSAIAYARDLAGGSQGVQRLFMAIGETIPQVGTTQEQAGTALLQMHLTAAQLQAGMDALELSPKDLSGMDEQQIKNIMDKGTIDRQAETDKFGKMISEIKPTKVMDMNGQMKSPELNPVLKLLGYSFNNPQQNNKGTIPQQNNQKITDFITKAKAANFTDQQIAEYLQGKQ
jgi:hypothetical protein